MTLNCPFINPTQIKMFEALLGIVVPIVKDFLLAACAAMLAYALNKIQTQFV